MHRCAGQHSRVFRNDHLLASSCVYRRDELWLLTFSNSFDHHQVKVGHSFLCSKKFINYRYRGNEGKNRLQRQEHLFWTIRYENVMNWIGKFIATLPLLVDLVAIWPDKILRKYKNKLDNASNNNRCSSQCRKGLTRSVLFLLVGGTIQTAITYY